MKRLFALLVVAAFSMGIMGCSDKTEAQSNISKQTAVVAEKAVQLNKELAKQAAELNGEIDKLKDMNEARDKEIAHMRSTLRRFNVETAQYIPKPEPKASATAEVATNTDSKKGDKSE